MSSEPVRRVAVIRDGKVVETASSMEELAAREALRFESRVEEMRSEISAAKLTPEQLAQELARFKVLASDAKQDLAESRVWFKTLFEDWQNALKALELHQDPVLAKAALKECLVFNMARFIDAASSATKTARARSGAASAHAEHRSMKAEVFNWLETNMARYKSMESAAEAIAGKLLPIKFRTARDWVGEWKRLQSAGKP